MKKQQRELATETFEIFYHDLNEDCQEAYLKFMGVDDPADLNEDICPLVIFDKPDPEEE